MYMLSEDGNLIIRLADKAFIPMTEDNKDYKEYLVWLSLGNIVLNFDPTLLN